MFNYYTPPSLFFLAAVVDVDREYWILHYLSCVVPLTIVRECNAMPENMCNGAIRNKFSSILTRKVATKYTLMHAISCNCTNNFESKREIVISQFAFLFLHYPFLVKIPSLVSPLFICYKNTQPCFSTIYFL